MEPIMTLRTARSFLSLFLLPVCIVCSTDYSALAQTLQVADASSLKAAVGTLRDGNTLQIAAGDYPGGFTVKNIKDLTIEATDTNHPPNFIGGNFAWHFSSCPGLKLQYLRVTGQTGNGINIDDGGHADHPVAGVTLKHLEIGDIGPRGNTDGIKCSGLDDLSIHNCSLSGWGGQAIDMVGCHRVLISECDFAGKEGFAQDSGIQCKGGSEHIRIENCQFENAGQRPINVGGSTSMPYFRPIGAKFEARDVVIQRNIIKGSPCACAFVGVDSATFAQNEILFPEKWVFRILQETNDAGFIACRNVTIEDNSIVFLRSQVSIEVNIGANTRPDTFQFKKNRWFAEDHPDRSRPTLPNEESDGVYGADPRIK